MTSRRPLKSSGKNKNYINTRTNGNTNNTNNNNNTRSNGNRIRKKKVTQNENKNKGAGNRNGQNGQNGQTPNPKKQKTGKEPEGKKLSSPPSSFVAPDPPASLPVPPATISPTSVVGNNGGTSLPRGRSRGRTRERGRGSGGDIGSKSTARPRADTRTNTKTKTRNKTNSNTNTNKITKTKPRTDEATKATTKAATKTTTKATTKATTKETAKETTASRSTNTMNANKKRKKTKPSTKPNTNSVYDRLNKYETFASADKKGKIRRSINKMDSKAVLSTNTHKNTYANTSTSTIISSTNTNVNTNTDTPRTNNKTINEDTDADTNTNTHTSTTVLSKSKAKIRSRSKPKSRQKSIYIANMSTNISTQTSSSNNKNYSKNNTHSANSSFRNMNNTSRNSTRRNNTSRNSKRANSAYSANTTINSISNNSRKQIPNLISPERQAIADMQFRIKLSLSSSGSEMGDNSAISSFGIFEEIENDNEKYDNEEESDDDDEEVPDDPTLYNLVFIRKFGAAEIFLNENTFTSKQIKDALYYQNNGGWNALMRGLTKRPPKNIIAPDALIMQMIEIGGKKLVTDINVWGDNALFCAVKNKRSLEIINLLLDVGGGKEYVLQQNFKGRTVLHVASELGDSMKTVQCLVNLGGKDLIYIKDDNGKTAQSFSLDVMNFLQKVGGDMNKKKVPKPSTILHEFVKDKRFDNVEIYLNDENVNLHAKRNALSYKDKDGWTALMLAIFRNAPDSVIEQMIFIGGVEILLITNKWENIALLYAISQKRSLNVISALVQKGGGKDCIAKHYGKGLTPLHWACECNSSPEVIKFLIKEGEKFFSASDNGTHSLLSMKCFQKQTPLHVACTHGPKTSLEVVTQLLTGCNDESLLQISDINSQFPIHIACQEKAPFSIIKILVEYGKKTSLIHSDSDGKIPLLLACQNGASLETITYLAEVGGKELVESIPFRIRKVTHRGVLLSHYQV